MMDEKTTQTSTEPTTGTVAGATTEVKGPPQEIIPERKVIRREVVIEMIEGAITKGLTTIFGNQMGPNEVSVVRDALKKIDKRLKRWQRK